MRPRIQRVVAGEPAASYFKPRGIPLRDLEEVTLAVEELEALRLADLERLDQREAAERMGVSRQTFGRVVAEARRKVAEALAGPKALRIEGGDYVVALRKFWCAECRHSWDEPFGTGRPAGCPACGSAKISRHPEDRGSGRGRSGRGQSRGKSQPPGRMPERP